MDEAMGSEAHFTPRRGLQTRRSAMDAVNIGANLRAARRASGMHHEEVCAALGVKKQSLMAWETGRSAAALAMAPTLADLYGMSWSQMFAGCDLGRPNGSASAMLAAPELMDILRRVDELPPDARAQLREMLFGRGVRVPAPCRS